MALDNVGAPFPTAEDPSQGQLADVIPLHPNIDPEAPLLGRERLNAIAERFQHYRTTTEDDPYVISQEPQLELIEKGDDEEADNAFQDYLARTTESDTEEVTPVDEYIAESLAKTEQEITGRFRRRFGFKQPGERPFKEAISESLQAWRSKNGLEKTKGMAVGSLSWANLVFGETVALWMQGAAQSGGASDLRSFAIGVGSALAVETVFTVPVAMKNKEQQPKEVVAEAMATGFWMGGAMGVENKKLPLKQAPYAIGAYMIFGTALAGAGEYNNTAATLMAHKEIIIPSLIGWALLKKRNELVGHKGFFDRMADRTVVLVERITRTAKNKPIIDSDEATASEEARVQKDSKVLEKTYNGAARTGNVIEELLS